MRSIDCNVELDSKRIQRHLLKCAINVALIMILIVIAQLMAFAINGLDSAYAADLQWPVPNYGVNTGNPFVLGRHNGIDIAPGGKGANIYAA